MRTTVEQGNDDDIDVKLIIGLILGFFTTLVSNIPNH